MTMMRNERNTGGFTLIELMIVVAIVGILATIAYPSYRDSVRRSNRAEGKALLVDAAARQERYFSNNNSYTTDMTALGFDADPAVSENGFYSMDAAACPGATIATCHVLTVTAIGRQADDSRCATMTLDSLGQKGASDSGGNDSTDLCW